MATASWPATLPQSLEVQGFNADFPDNRIISPMASGPPKLRARGTGASEVIRGANHMTATQLATLWTFYFTTLDSGTKDFDRNHPRTGASKEWHFIGLPTYTRAGFMNGEAAYRVQYDFIIKDAI